MVATHRNIDAEKTDSLLLQYETKPNQSLGRFVLNEFIFNRHTWQWLACWGISYLSINYLVKKYYFRSMHNRIQTVIIKTAKQIQYNPKHNATINVSVLQNTCSKYFRNIEVKLSQTNQHSYMANESLSLLHAIVSASAGMRLLFSVEDPSIQIRHVNQDYTVTKELIESKNISELQLKEHILIKYYQSNSKWMLCTLCYYVIDLLFYIIPQQLIKHGKGFEYILHHAGPAFLWILFRRYNVGILSGYFALLIGDIGTILLKLSLIAQASIKYMDNINIDEIIKQLNGNGSGKNVDVTGISIKMKQALRKLLLKPLLNKATVIFAIFAISFVYMRLYIVPKIVYYIRLSLYKNKDENIPKKVKHSIMGALVGLMMIGFYWTKIIISRIVRIVVGNRMI